MIEDFRLLFEASWDAHDLARMQCPVLILRGDKTPPVAARVAQVLATLIGPARLETIPGFGHMAPVTDPGRIAAAITDHIRTAGSARGPIGAALRAT